MSVPFHRPFITGTELKNLAEALEAGELAGGQNKTFVQQVQGWLEGYCETKKALFTTSCTDALEMAALLIDIEPGDEVILPSYTFVSTANAFVLRGAKPVFIDSRPDTLNLDESLLESKLTSKTKAVIAVHYAGVSCEMNSIKAFTDKHKLWLIEDNAQGLGGRYHNKPLGSFGHLSTLSFHETKNATAGEGGALLVNDAALIERAEVLLEKGTNRSQFLNGKVDKYTWVDKGSSFLGSNLAAAVLMAQLSAWQEIQERRRKVWRYYHNSLSDWASTNSVILPYIPENIEPAYHLFYCIFPNKHKAAEAKEHLKINGIQTASHFVPLHKTPMGMALGGEKTQCLMSENLSDRILRLPLFPSMSSEQKNRVVDYLKRLS